MEIKSSEQIRIALGVTQKEFAQMLGLARRTYNARIAQEQDWKLQDLINLTSLNDGCAMIKSGQDYYVVNIKKC